MDAAPIHFQFDQTPSAKLAVETLDELGYTAKLQESGGTSLLHLTLEKGDLTSALEIVQAFGGKWVEYSDSSSETAAYNTAYEIDDVAIPAHVVNEDWPAGYAETESATDDYGAVSTSSPYQEKDGRVDPSGEDYDHFLAGIRL
ncbi:hypothetical protein [Paenibacillus thalictri]|uniref:DNA/RNA helicase n=1 Tax=Paenibacillus thalictri TaxID=2527873 RepID=A0A4V2J3C5_9BACL|nr:hypothetical protein [Paenibacillus thalictri]TBL71195.1 hypothetical protein EYB31_30940 [Paenibacillus thalictri]